MSDSLKQNEPNVDESILHAVNNVYQSITPAVSSRTNDELIHSRQNT